MQLVKFRAWLQNYQKMSSAVEEIDFADEQVIVKHDVSGEWGLRELLPFSEVELMQFIGLYDITGDEVFEGDIVRVLPNNGDPELRIIDPNDYDFFAFVANGNCLLKIIGNVHENPELLEAE